MDLARFKAGDLGLLEALVAQHVADLWRILRSGFTCTDGGEKVVILGMSDLDEIEATVVHGVAACLTPEARQALPSAEAVFSTLLAGVRDEAVRRARVEARELTPHHAPEVFDLDAAVTSGRLPGDLKPAQDPGIAQRLTAELETVEAFLAEGDERRRQVVALRFRQGKSCAETAKAFDCGQAAVREREGRIRRKLRHALRVAEGEGDEKIERGPAYLDALLSGAPHGDTPCSVTSERLVRSVLTRTFIEAPRPFAERAMWAAGVALVAAGLWALMAADVLPYYGDDKLPEPQVKVTCEGACAPGATARLSVRAPKDASHVAFLLVDGGEVRPLLLDPGGNSLTLPFGARSAMVDVPYPAKLPTALTSSLTATAMAVFSTEELGQSALLRFGGGGGAPEGVLSAETLVPLRSGS